MRYTYRKTLACILTLAVLLSLNISANANAPIMIYDADGLKAMANDLTASYKLGCDINLNGESFATLGSDSELFTGTLDGDGHTIRNIKFTDNKGRTTANLGLFAYSNGTIKNLTLSGVTYQVPSCSYLVLGALCANQVKTGKITNCAVYGDVALTADNIEYNLVVGGLVGSFYKGTIENSVSNINISYVGNNACDAGGICADLGGTIQNCVNFGSVNIDSKNSYANVGGIVGKLHGSVSTPAKITNAINCGEITGASADTLTVGGITGNINTSTSAGNMNGCINTGKINYTSYVNITDSSQKFGSGAIAGIYSGTSSSNYYLNTSYSVAVQKGSVAATAKTMAELRALPLDDGWYLPSDDTKVKALTSHKGITGLELIGATSLPSGKLAIELGAPISVKAYYDDGTNAIIDGAYKTINNTNELFDTTFEYAVKNVQVSTNLATYKKGDLNRDTFITGTDAVILRNCILEENASELDIITSDLNGDTVITITDLKNEIDTIING